MRIFTTMAAVLLCTCLAISVPAFSQEGTQDQPRDQKAHDKDKDNKGHEAKQNDQDKRQDENRRDESRPAARPEDNRDRGEVRQQEQPRPEERRNEDRRNENVGRQDERRQDQVRQDQGRVEERDHARNAGEQGRPGNHRGARIPQERFRASFGREHHFHVERARIINQAQPEFIYSGYTFQLAQPWPAEWSYDDDCYVDYVDDDYYLFDAYHPGFRILVFVIGE